MGYHIDLSTIRLSQYKKRLKQRDLLPSRQILKEAIDERFDVLKAQGIKSLDDLVETLKTKKKLQAFATSSGLSEEYLTILIREVKSLQPKPNKIADFPDVSSEVVETLQDIGIANTKQLFDHILTDQDRAALARKTGIPKKGVLELACLTDLSRIQWVGAVFARLLYEAGYRCVADVASADYEELYSELIKVNENLQYTKGKFGVNDIKLCVAAAGNVPQDIQFD